MTLQRFLNAVGDSRWLWLGRRSWKPAPADRFPAWTFLRQLLVVVFLFCVPGAILAWRMQSLPQMKGGLWPLQDTAALGLVFGLVGLLFVALAWNRRAAQLNAAGLAAPPPLPKLPWWWRWPLGVAYAFALFAFTPFVLALAIDNALGTAAWNRQRAQLVARGEPLTFAEVAGAPPADADNAALTPLLKPLFDFHTVVTNGRSDLVWNDPVGRLRLEAFTHRPAEKLEGSPDPRGTNTGRASLDPLARGIRSAGRRLSPEVVRAARAQMGLPTNVPPDSPDFIPLPGELLRRYGLLETNRTRVTNEDLKSLVITNPAVEVLAYLKAVEPEMQEIAEAVRRPRARFDLRLNTPLSSTAYAALSLPAYAKIKALTLLFSNRARARVLSTDATGAFADTLTLFQLSKLTAEDPLLIALLVRIAQDTIAVSAVREGLAERLWTDAQLAELQGILRQLDRREALIQAFRGERVLGIETVESWLNATPSMQATRVPMGEGSDEASYDDRPPISRWPFLQPRGMFRQFQVAQSRLVDQLIADVKDPNWPRTLTEREDPLAFLRRAGLAPVTRGSILASMLAPALDKASGKVARLHTVARLAEIACALERHRLRHGHFPESLDALAPASIDTVPADPMTDQPFHYRRTDNGWFKLWSVGLNGRDDGGVMTRRDNDANGDWVWPVPGPVGKDELRLL